jgi:hypothetical protein
MAPEDETEIEIVLDGEADYLRMHRLSLGELGLAMSFLLRAARLAATAVVRNKPDSASVSRVAAAAKGLDLQLTSLKDGSLMMGLACVYPPETDDPYITMGSSLAERTAARLLSDIENESAGRESNRYVRGYLRSLPPAVKSQRYVARVGGREIGSATVTSLKLIANKTPMPRVDILQAPISALSFEPGAETVGLRVDSRVRHFQCSPELLERAVSMRGREVRATVLLNEHVARFDGTIETIQRLLRIDPVHAEVAGTPSARWSLIKQKWHETFVELAK